MNDIDFHKIGEEFEHNGRKYSVINTCELCDLRDTCNNPSVDGIKAYLIMTKQSIL